MHEGDLNLHHVVSCDIELRFDISATRGVCASRARVADRSRCHMISHDRIANQPYDRARKLNPGAYCKSRIFRMHVIFVYFVRGGFCTKIKCMRKLKSKSENLQRPATVQKFHAYERLESPGYKKWVRTKYSGCTVVAFCDCNARFCDQKTWCSRNFAPKTRRLGTSLRPDEHSSRPDSENKN